MRLFRSILGLLALAVLPSGVAADFSLKLIVGVHPMVNYPTTHTAETVGLIRDHLVQQCGDFRFTSVQQMALSADLALQFNSGVAGAMNKFAATGTSIQVVNSISYCNGPSGLFGAILGCARPGGPIVVVPRSTRARDAQVWAHEMGHAQGLTVTFPGYVEGHSKLNAALMYAYAAAQRWTLTADECQQFASNQTFPPVSAPFEVLVTGLDARAVIGSPDPTDTVVEVGGEGAPEVLAQGEMVDIILPDPVVLSDSDSEPEIGFDPATYLGAEWVHGMDVPTVLEHAEPLLSASIRAIDARDYALWPNAVLVIGFLGDEGATGLLDQVMQDSGGREAEAAFQVNDARINSATAYGYIAAQGNMAGFERLTALLNPRGNISNLDFADERSPDVLSQELARSAHIGLAIAAANNPEAAVLLEFQRNESALNNIDLGVTLDFFDGLEQLTAQVAAGALDNDLR